MLNENNIPALYKEIGDNYYVFTNEDAAKAKSYHYGHHPKLQEMIKNPDQFKLCRYIDHRA